MKKIKPILFYCGFVLQLFIYFSVYFSPQYYWILGFISYLIPLLLIFHTFLLFYRFRKLHSKRYFTLFLFIIGFSYIFRTVTWHFHTKNLPKDSFEVMSYNVRVFNSYEPWGGIKSDSSKKLIRWICNNQADIKCLQEFYSIETRSFFNTIKKFKDSGNYHFYTSPMKQVNNEKGFFGLAIFSKFPILSGKALLTDKANYHQGIVADIKVKNDTITIINLHLESIIIGKDWGQNFQHLKEGFVKRAKQIQTVKKYIKNNPYPVIVCGDFNDLPYSYTYQSLGNILWNTFETAGQGTGFTYVGLPFLRIDNQFYSAKFKAYNFRVHQEMTWSDHYPISAFYQIQ